MPSRTIAAPSTILVSHYWSRNIDLTRLRPLRIVGDSGAYSARVKGVTISNDDLGEWADRYRNELYWVACLDVAGDQKATRHSWHYLNRTFDLQTVPSIHFGDSPRELDYYADHGCDFVGLGGSAGRYMDDGMLMRWLISVFRYARDNHPQMRFHGWGMTGRSPARLPFWSVDSSSWASGYRWGRLDLYTPSGRRKNIKMNGRDVFAPQMRQLLTNEYGIDPADVAYSNSETLQNVIRVSALSASARLQWMRKRHPEPVTPPEWGIMQDRGIDGTGPNLVLVDSSYQNLAVVRDLYREDVPGWGA